MLATHHKGIMMIENDIAAPISQEVLLGDESKHNSFLNSLDSNGNVISFSHPKELFESNDTMDDNHNGTGTPTSERISYPVNPVIRDVVSYRQNQM